MKEQNKADIFDTAFKAAARSEYTKATKLFQHVAIETWNGQPVLSSESCDFIRGVGMIEAMENGTTSDLSIRRVAHSIDYYGLYAKESKVVADYVNSLQGQAPDPASFPVGSFAGDMNHQYGWSMVLSSPGRWCAAAVLNMLRNDSPESLRAAHNILETGYEADGATEGTHQILDLAAILLYLRAGLFNRVLDVASNYSSFKDPDWQAYANEPDYETNSKFHTEIARAALATAHAHLGNFDTALAYTSGEGMTSSAACAQTFFVQACVHRARGETEEANRCFAFAESSNPAREDIKEAHNTEDFQLRQTSIEVITQRTDAWDIDTEPSLAARQALESEKVRQDIVDAALAELDSYIGLTELKKEVRTIAEQIAYNKRLEERGLQTSAQNMAMTFQGPPGVGKTSVARVLHKVLYGYGILKDDSFVEVDRSGLIGQYQGETVKKTNAKLTEAQNGTFFLDEAYSLVQGENDMYGNEALDAIVKFMEDHRGDMCVILAGYKGDMQQLLKRNEGLNSRFKRHLNFPSYSTREIAEISAVVAKKDGKIMSDECVDTIERVLTERVMNVETGMPIVDPSGVNLIDKMGNGRGARNIKDEAEVFLMRRLQGKDMNALSNEELQTFTPSDVEKAAMLVVDRTIES